PSQSSGHGRRLSGRDEAAAAGAVTRPGPELGAQDDPSPELPRTAAGPQVVPAGRAPQLTEEGPCDPVPALGHLLELSRRLFERDVDDLVALEGGHPPPTFLLDEIGGLEPETRREHPVSWCGAAAALHVAEHGHTSLVPGAFLDVPPERLTNSPEPDMAELVCL